MASTSTQAASPSWRQRIAGRRGGPSRIADRPRRALRGDGGAVERLPLRLQRPQHPPVDLGVRGAGDRHDLRHLLGRHRPLGRIDPRPLGRRRRDADLEPRPSLVGRDRRLPGDGRVHRVGERDSSSPRAAIPPFIVTLGMLGVARGFALVLSNGMSIYGLAAADGLARPGTPFRRADAGHHPSPDGARRPCAARAHALWRLRPGHRRQRGGGAGDGRPGRAAEGAALRALGPALRPRRASVRRADQFGRADRRASATSSPPSPRRSSAAPTCSAGAAASSAR